MVTDVVTTTGTWVCPTGVTSVTVDCWGGGGGSTGGSFGGSGRGGAGGGAYSQKVNIAVTPGNSYTVTVGVGGTGGSVGSGAGTDGGDSWFSTTGTVLAKGGGTTGTGGASGSGVGNTKFSGGDGGACADNTGAFGGGGGGGGGTTGNGGNGTASSGVSTNGVGGTGTSVGGGRGGDGGSGSGVAIRGGGGGGADGGAGAPNGARGEVQITYIGIGFDASSNSGYQAAQSSYSWSHTCTGNNRYLLVGISMLSLAQTVSGITYNSVALTFLGAKSSITGAARVELWGLVAPSTGSNTIAVTLTGSIASAGNASSYADVNQSLSTEAFNSNQATNIGAADATVTVTTVADNDWCVDILATDDTAVTVGAGQTQTGNVSGAGGSSAMSYKGPKTPAGTVTMSWTNVGALATWATGSIALRPTTASGATTGWVVALV